MDKVIETLNTIESKAARIVEVTANEKDALRENFTQKIKEYQKNSEELTTKQLKELKENLSLQSKKSLEQFASDSNAEIAALNTYFASHHTELAAQIFQSITGK